MSAGMVIIGAGEAGLRAALTLRELGYQGAVTLIGAETHPPYERPPLSKSLMTAPELPAAPPIASLESLAAQDITFLPGRRVGAILRDEHAVELEDGGRLPYHKLLIATGARARRLNLPGCEAAGVLYLRTLSDALAIRPWLRPGGRLIVIGGGFIGLEVAASAIERGASVSVVEAAPRILGRAVPAPVAALVAARHRARGINLIEGIGLVAIEETPGGPVLLLADGRRLRGEAIIAGIGALPETALAEAAGLALDNGVRVDERLATDDPDIFAAGDCCSFPHPVFEGRRLRLEAWRNAQDQGRHAAGSMLGSDTPFATVPWFWSDQHGDTLQIAGLPDEADHTVTRNLGAVTLFLHLKGDRLVAASAYGPFDEVARDIRLAERLIAQRATPGAEALADSGLPLRKLLRREAAAIA